MGEKINRSRSVLLSKKWGEIMSIKPSVKIGVLYPYPSGRQCLIQLIQNIVQLIPKQLIYLPANQLRRQALPSPTYT
jgi:hypothetical protein